MLQDGEDAGLRVGASEPISDVRHENRPELRELEQEEEHGNTPLFIDSPDSNDEELDDHCFGDDILSVDEYDAEDSEDYVVETENSDDYEVETEDENLSSINSRDAVRAQIDREESTIRRSKLSKHFPAINEMFSRMCDDADASLKEARAFYFSISNATKLQKSNILDEYQKIWISAIAKKKLKESARKVYTKRGMAIDNLTSIDVLNVFLELPEEKQIALLRRLQIIIALQEPVSQRDKEMEYKDYCERMRSYAAFHADLHGFETSIITVDGRSNSSNAAGSLIETNNIKGAIEEVSHVKKEELFAALKARRNLTVAGRVTNVAGQPKNKQSVYIPLMATPTTATVLAPKKLLSDRTFEFSTDKEADKMIAELLVLNTTQFWHAAKSKLWDCWSSLARKNTIFYGPEPFPFYWRTVLPQLARARAHIYNYPSNIPHPGMDSNKGIQSIGIEAMCNLIRGFYTNTIKWSNSEYPKRKEDGTPIVIVGVDDNGDEDPLYVYSTGEFVNGPAKLTDQSVNTGENKGKGADIEYDRDDSWNDRSEEQDTIDDNEDAGSPTRILRSKNTVLASSRSLGSKRRVPPASTTKQNLKARKQYKSQETISKYKRKYKQESTKARGDHSQKEAPVRGRFVHQQPQGNHPISMDDMSNEQLGSLIRQNPQAFATARDHLQYNISDNSLAFPQVPFNSHSVYGPSPAYDWVRVQRPPNVCLHQQVYAPRELYNQSIPAQQPAQTNDSLFAQPFAMVNPIPAGYHSHPQSSIQSNTSVPFTPAARITPLRSKYQKKPSRKE